MITMSHLNKNPIISAEELKQVDASEYLLFDASSGPNAYSNFLDAHLQGAQFVDLETQLSAKEKDPKHGGRHPLPSVADFAILLSGLGIKPDSNVIVYDRKSGANAATRFWWMLKSIGHAHAQVLDGGYQMAVEVGLPVASGPAVAQELSYYQAEAWLWPTITLPEMVEAIQNQDAIIIDVREAFRYQGISEPIDLVAGHIPGAYNIFYGDNLLTDGTFRPKIELQGRYASLMAMGKPIIVHCGSGVSACHTILALLQAGLRLPTLYVGSWSEWSRNLELFDFEES